MNSFFQKRITINSAEPKISSYFHFQTFSLQPQQMLPQVTLLEAIYQTVQLPLKREKALCNIFDKDSSTPQDL